MALAAVIFYAATVPFLLNFALGLLVLFYIADTKPFRWLTTPSFRRLRLRRGDRFRRTLRGAPYRWALLPALALFAVLSCVRALPPDTPPSPVAPSSTTWWSDPNGGAKRLQLLV
jgi:hypothetical protein